MKFPWNQSQPIKLLINLISFLNLCLRTSYFIMTEENDISKKIEQYEDFLHNKLKMDLKQTWDLRDKIYEEISD